MDMDLRECLINRQAEAAGALDAGLRLDKRNAPIRPNGRTLGQEALEAIGGAIAEPSLFWSGAVQLGGGADAEAQALQLRYAAARMQAGDFSFVRESLLGQASWLSTMAVRLGVEADAESRFDRAGPMYREALRAQRQAGQALVQAAALNSIERDCGRIVQDED
jgi:hypothetical protein